MPFSGSLGNPGVVPKIPKQSFLIDIRHNYNVLGADTADTQVWFFGKLVEARYPSLAH